MGTKKAMRRYQGREITTTIQAPTLTSLNAMLRGLRAYAKSHGLESVRVLTKERDPDTGGWKCIIVAHNWNPLKWIREKWEARGGGYEARLARARAREKRRLDALELKQSKAARKAQETRLKAAQESERGRLERARFTTAKVMRDRRRLHPKITGDVLVAITMMGKRASEQQLVAGNNAVLLGELSHQSPQSIGDIRRGTELDIIEVKDTAIALAQQGYVRLMEPFEV